MRPALRLGVSIIALVVLVPRATAGVFPAQVTDLRDVGAVIDAARDKGASELPAEALAYYRAGLEAVEDGATQTAVTYFQSAALCDPTLAEAHLALARVRLFSNPRTAIEDIWRAALAATASFQAQHLLLVNVLFGILILAAMGLFVLTGFATLQYFSRIHHSIREYLAIWFAGRLAGVLGAFVMIAPVLWRLGVMPLCFAFMGIMWPWMRSRERRWIGTLAGIVIASPFLLWGLSPLIYSPLDPSARPFLLAHAMKTAYSAGMASELRTSLEDHPDDPNLHFAIAMVYKRGGYLSRAADHYVKALDLGAPSAAVENNLGVIAFVRGNYDKALDLLQKSVNDDPDRGASHFNLSQTFAKKLYFEKADQELARANELSFNRIRTALRHTEGEARQTMIDEPLPAKELWKAAWNDRRGMPALPDWLTFGFAGSLWLLSPILIGSFLLTRMLGRRLHQSLPSTGCTNCDRPICRRCVRRVRKETYCAHCGDVLLRIQSNSYSKLVLESQIRRNRRATLILSRFTSWIFPGLHAAKMGRTSTAAGLGLTATVGLLGMIHHSLPVTRLAWIDKGPNPWWPEIPVALLSAALIVSLITVSKLGKSRGLRSPLGGEVAKPAAESAPLEDTHRAA